MAGSNTASILRKLILLVFYSMYSSSIEEKSWYEMSVELLYAKRKARGC